MSSLFEKIKNVFLYASLDKTTFRDAQNDFRRSNLLLLKGLSAIGTVVFLVMAFTSPSVDELSSFNNFYLAAAIFCGLILLFSASFGEKLPKIVMPLVYICEAALYAIGIILGSMLATNEPAVAFIVILIVLPQLFCGRPIVSSLITIAAAAAYIISASINKAPALAQLDVVDVICYGLLSMVLGTILTCSKATGVRNTIRLAESERRLSEALDHAENVNRSKISFLSNISHEIRTPLTAIIGFTTLAKKENLTGKTAEYIDKIDLSGRQLLEQVDRIVNEKEIETGEGGEDRGKTAPDTDTKKTLPEESDSGLAVPELIGKNVLLVEDNEINCEIATTLLEELGLVVDTADDGTVALEKAAKAKKGDYELILMDIRMPIMDGYEATRRIRALNSPIASVPIIALSACAYDEEKQRSIESGMNEHITKPIDVAVLKDVLCRYLLTDNK